MHLERSSPCDSSPGVTEANNPQQIGHFTWCFSMFQPSKLRKVLRKLPFHSGKKNLISSYVNSMSSISINSHGNHLPYLHPPNAWRIRSCCAACRRSSYQCILGAVFCAAYAACFAARWRRIWLLVSKPGEKSQLRGRKMVRFQRLSHVISLMYKILSVSVD